MSPEIVFMMKDLQDQIAKMRVEVDEFAQIIKTVQDLKVDQIRAELEQHEQKVQMQTKFVEKYVDEIYNQIDDCKGFVKKYSIDMLVVTEDMQKFCRQYKTYFDE